MGRFTETPKESLLGLQILGVLNFFEKKIGDNTSEVLVLGVQYKGKESGEAIPLTVLTPTKLGSKVF